MKTLLDHIIDEFDEDGIFICEDSPEDTYHRQYVRADKEKIKIAFIRAITKALNKGSDF